MSAISFKSVGIKQSNPLLRAKKSPVPIGIKTPLQLGTGRSGIFDMHFNFPEQISDNLRNILLSNHGDRLGRFDFGANLNSLAFELTSKDDFDQEAMLNIRDAVERSMPYVELSEFESDFMVVSPNTAPDGLTYITIRISYSVPKLKIVNSALEIKLLVGG